MDIVQWIVDQTMKPIKAFLYAFNIDKWSCRHCEGSGFCTGGYDDKLGNKYSCHSCIKAFDANWNGIQESKRVRCSICNGTGKDSTSIQQSANRKLPQSSNVPKISCEEQFKN